MRTNTRLVSCFLIAMFLVNFHGTLVLRSQSKTRESRPRNLSFSWKTIAGFFIGIARLLYALFLFFLAIFVYVGSWLFIWRCYLPSMYIGPDKECIAIIGIHESYALAWKAGLQLVRIGSDQDMDVTSKSWTFSGKTAEIWA